MILRNLFLLSLLSLSLSVNIAGAKPDAVISQPAERTASCPNISNGFADIVEPLMPSVVNISTVQQPKRGPMLRKGLPFGGEELPEEFNQFFERLPPGIFDEGPFNARRKMVSLGSGFIVDDEGHIATNYHVIADADEITVRLHNGTLVKAKIVGVDKDTDIALLKIKTKKPLAFAKFGDSDKVRVGDWVIAVGNPFGLANTITVGVVSANGRDISSEAMIDNYIQTDAAINRGNSGGPMFNTAGEVIGMNTQILSPSGLNIGIGFATPSSIVSPIIAKLKAGGKTKEGGLLGVTMQKLTEELAESLGITAQKGALVIEVRKKTPADKAGIEIGDVVTAFNGQTVKSTKELQRLVKSSPVGKSLNLTVIRQGKQKNLTVTLEYPSKGLSILQKMDEKFKQFSKSLSVKEVLGAHMAVLDDDLRSKFKISNSVDGIVLLDVDKKSIWSSQDLTEGDVICSAGGIELKTVEQLENIIKESRNAGKKSVFLLVNIKGVKVFIPLPIED